MADWCTGARCAELDPVGRKPILRVLTLGGALMPLNPDPDPEGNVVLVPGPNGLGVRARVIDAGAASYTSQELDAFGDRYQPHWATCPDQKLFRDRKIRTTPKCAECRQPLHKLLVAIGRKYHWLCGPDPDPDGTRRLAREAAARARPQPQLDLEEVP